MLTQKLGQALALAVQAHDGQMRKGTAIPYIAHPMGVASIALEFGASEDQAIAALLHDALEDGGPHYAPLIEAQFGAGVLALVQACTDGVPDASGAKADWGERKRAYLAHLAQAPDEVLLVSGADKLHNARAIVTDLHETGAEVLDKFNGEPEAILTYYRECLRIGKAKGITTKLLIPLEIAVEEIAGYVPTTSVA